MVRLIWLYRYPRWPEVDVPDPCWRRPLLVNVPHSTAAGGGPTAKLSVALSRSPYTASGALILFSVLLAQSRLGSEVLLTVVGLKDVAADDESNGRVATECDPTVLT